MAAHSICSESMPSIRAWRGRLAANVCNNKHRARSCPRLQTFEEKENGTQKTIIVLFAIVPVGLASASMASARGGRGGGAGHHGGVGGGFHGGGGAHFGGGGFHGGHYGGGYYRGVGRGLAAGAIVGGAVPTA